MAGNSFSKSLKKSKSSKQLTAGSGDGSEGMTFSLSFSESVFKSLESVSGDTSSLKAMAGNSVSTDLRVWKLVRYGVSKGLDTAYWSFLEYGILGFFPLWSLVSAGTDTPYLFDGYGVLVFRILKRNDEYVYRGCGILYETELAKVKTDGYKLGFLWNAGGGEQQNANPLPHDIDSYAHQQEVLMGKSPSYKSFQNSADGFICSLLPETSQLQVEYSPGVPHFMLTDNRPGPFGGNVAVGVEVSHSDLQQPFSIGSLSTCDTENEYVGSGSLGTKGSFGVNVSIGTKVGTDTLQQRRFIGSIFTKEMETQREESGCVEAQGE
ncbi:hypothetical protein Tco_0721971 [Tanacetum coccineum]